MMLILATKNPHKVAEIRLILAGLPVEMRSLADLGLELPLPEEADTYAGNARSKVVAAAEVLAAVGHGGGWVLADDSGLEVDALGGAPGVYSHRFSGREAADRDNISLLLSRLVSVPPPGRTARFRAAAALCSPRGEIWLAEGRWEGSIAPGPRGAAGFGYDPVFVPRAPRWQGTVAEMDPATKAVFSHRGQAVRALLPVLKALVPPA